MAGQRNNVIVWIGRASAVAAVMFGFLIGGSLIVSLSSSGTTADAASVLIGGSALLTVAGGTVYLLGLDRIGGPRGRSLRIGGWMLYAVGLLLPTSLMLFQLLAIAGGGLGAFAQAEDPLRRVE